MKVMISSNAPWIPSGYGQQSKFLVEYLKSQGHQIIFDCNFGLSSSYVEIDDVIYLFDKDYGNFLIKNYVQKFKPDAVISLFDWFAYDPKSWSDFECPWYSWTPIDSNVVDGKEQVFSKLFQSFLNDSNVVTMSEFGTDQLKKFDAKPVDQIYHMIDHQVFHKMDKDECRSQFLKDYDKYNLIIGMVAGNYDPIGDRKAFNLQFKGLKIFAENNPKLKILLYLHTELSAEMNGINLNAIIDNLELRKYIDIISTPSSNIRFLPFSKSQLAALYNCFDILMNASDAEGFGIPIVEAQSCGVPVLTHNFSAMPELTKYGYAVKSYDRENKMFRKSFASCDECGVLGQAHFLMSRRLEPDYFDIANGLQIIYDNIDEGKSEMASQWVAETFNPSVIGGAWNDLLNGKRG